MSKPLKNVAISIHDRLLTKAKRTNRPFNELLQYYAMERFLYRVSRSDYADRFILKGALMFAVWNVPDSRATMDIDLLGRMKNDLVTVEGVVKRVCAQRVEDDGLTFNPKSVKAARIVEGADYKGVRVRFRGNLGTARVVMQVDIGFGDPVTPGPVVLKFPTLLDFPAPKLNGYRPETAIAEKFEAMCTRGMENSRMKDFYDVWLLCRQFDFEGEVLAEAIKNTFDSRHTEVPVFPMVLGQEFGGNRAKGIQWKAFLRKSRLADAPLELQTVVNAIRMFLGPVSSALGQRKAFKSKWKAQGPWGTIKRR